MKDELDEIVEGEITKPESIEGICEGIDVVFSSVGITRQKDKLTFRDVDYQGNKNLLDIALASGVRKFIYVSVFDGPNLLHLDIVKAHEDFVDALKSSGMSYAIIRPTGYFSDMGEFFNMAKKGRVFLFGPGANKVNPIHGVDLAITCVDAMESKEREIDVGGPEVLSWREIARLACEAQGKPVKISSVPIPLMKLAATATRIFSKHQGELLAFFTEMGTSDVIAPKTGTRTLKAHYEELAGRDTKRKEPDSGRKR
jgi:uncharacterized protein YbjT (DUF2867 family)